jgi:transcription elongation GreA/GreB family factor
MSFVREPDELPPEPLFELKVSPYPNPVTARGMKLIDQNIAELDAQIAGSPIELVKERLLRDLRYWTARKETAHVVERPDDSDEVGFGSRVAFRRGDGPPETIEIVGEDESDPHTGRIAWVAPLASAMLGARAGDVVTLENRRPPTPITILSIEKI